MYTTQMKKNRLLNRAACAGLALGLGLQGASPIPESFAQQASMTMPSVNKEDGVGTIKIKPKNGAKGRVSPTGTESCSDAGAKSADGTLPATFATTIKTQLFYGAKVGDRLCWFAAKDVDVLSTTRDPLTFAAVTAGVVNFLGSAWNWLMNSNEAKPFRDAVIGFVVDTSGKAVEFVGSLLTGKQGDLAIDANLIQTIRQEGADLLITLKNNEIRRIPAEQWGAVGVILDVVNVEADKVIVKLVTGEDLKVKPETLVKGKVLRDLKIAKDKATGKAIAKLVDNNGRERSVGAASQNVIPFNANKPVQLLKTDAANKRMLVANDDGVYWISSDNFAEVQAVGWRPAEQPLETTQTLASSSVPAQTVIVSPQYLGALAPVVATPVTASAWLMDHRTQQRILPGQQVPVGTEYEVHVVANQDVYIRVLAQSVDERNPSVGIMCQYSPDATFAKTNFAAPLVPAGADAWSYIKPQDGNRYLVAEPILSSADTIYVEVIAAKDVPAGQAAFTYAQLPGIDAAGCVKWGSSFGSASKAARQTTGRAPGKTVTPAPSVCGGDTGRGTKSPGKTKTGVVDAGCGALNVVDAARLQARNMLPTLKLELSLPIDPNSTTSGSGVAAHVTAIENTIKDECGVGVSDEQCLAQQHKRVAVLIGNNDYDNGSVWGDLSDIPEEMRTLQETLRGVGYEVEYLPNLKREALVNAFHNIASKYGQQDKMQLFVYYSGHGITWKENGAKVGAIVPVDAISAPDESKNATRAETAQFVRYSEINQILLGMQTTQILFTSDACYAGTAFLPTSRPETDTTRSTRTMSKSFARFHKTVRTYMTPVGRDQKAPGKSRLVVALVDLLQNGNGSNSNGVISQWDMYSFLRTNGELADDNVILSSPPYSNEFSGDFYFFTAKKAKELGIAK